MDQYLSSYYNLLTVCAGESQGRNPIGKALVSKIAFLNLNVFLTIVFLCHCGLIVKCFLNNSLQILVKMATFP